MDIVYTTKEYVDYIKELSLKISNMYKERQINEASKLMYKFSEDMMCLAETLNILNLNSWIQKVNDKLNEVVVAFENEDYDLISELIEYEIITILDEININLNNFKE